MKKRTLLGAILLQLAFSIYAQTVPNTVDKILQSIDRNNKEIKAMNEDAKAKKMENLSVNNLSDPTLSYASTYANDADNNHSTEFIALQSFDFPTQYISRHKQAKLQNVAVTKEQEIGRRDLLLKAKHLCLDIILLNKEKEFLNKRVEVSNHLYSLFNKKMEEGESNAIEFNKLKMEVMNLKAQVSQNNVNHRTALQQLLAMNDNIPVELEQASYPEVKSVDDLNKFREEMMASDIDLQAIAAYTKAADKQVTVEKQSWLPKFEVGFRRNTTSVNAENGFIIGGTLPIFENRKKVGIAKAKALSTKYMQESVRIDRENAIIAMFNEIQQMKASIDAYDLSLMYNYLDLLNISLESGEISLIEYYVEAEDVFSKFQSFFELENRYQKLIAEVYKNSL